MGSNIPIVLKHTFKKSPGTRCVYVFMYILKCVKVLNAKFLYFIWFLVTFNSVFLNNRCMGYTTSD
jgi:hypothetical protein